MGTEYTTTAVEISEPLIPGSHKIRDVDSDDSEPIPEWKVQITVRGLVVSASLGSLFCIITHKLNLTVGIISSLNVAAGLLGFFFVKSWIGFLSELGFLSKLWTRVMAQFKSSFVAATPSNQGVNNSPSLYTNNRPALRGFVSGGTIGGDTNRAPTTTSFNPTPMSGGNTTV